MDFSFITTALIDIGVFSIGGISVSLICLWQLRKQVAKHQAYRDESEQRYSTLSEQHNVLLQEFRTFQSATDRRYNALQEEHNALQSAHVTLIEQHNTLEHEHNALQAAHTTLQQEFSTLQATHTTLQQEHEELKQENATLRTALNAITREQKALQTAHDRLAGRHDELVERVMPVFEILAREKLMEINSRTQN